MSYVRSEIKNETIKIINNVVNEEISNISNLDEMIYITKNSSDDIQMIDFNSSYVNKILNATTNKLLDKLDEISNNSSFCDNCNIYKYSDGIIYEVPLGLIFNNIFIGNLGPKIPLKLSVVGDVFSNVNTVVKEYGINNALVEISISVSINERVIIPFLSENINVSTSIPISLKLIQGNIPIYYGNSFKKNSNILSTPTE